VINTEVVSTQSEDFVSSTSLFWEQVSIPTGAIPPGIIPTSTIPLVPIPTCCYPWENPMHNVKVQHSIAYCSTWRNYCQLARYTPNEQSSTIG